MIRAKWISIITLTAVLCAVGIFTYAWMSKNVNVGSREDIGLGADDAVATYDVYRYDLAEGKGTRMEKKADATEATKIEISDVAFNQYDMIFLARNRYTPVFARVLITRIESIDDTKGGTVTLTISRDTTKAELDENGKLADFVSSVLRFSATVDSKYEDVKNETDDDEFYKHVDEALYATTSGDNGYKENEQEDDSKTFVKITTGGTESAPVYSYDKDDEITLTVTYAADDWEKVITIDGEEADVLCVYLYMSYDEKLINCYITDHDMRTISIGSDVVDFANDLSQLKVKIATSD